MEDFIVAVTVYGFLALVAVGGLWFASVFAWIALARLWVDTPLGDWADQKLAARTCPTCQKRDRHVDALLVEDTALLCPKHQRRLERIAELEKELLEPLPTEVKRMEDPKIDFLLKPRAEIDEFARMMAQARAWREKQEHTCDACTGKDVEGLSSFDTLDGTGRVVARYWVGKAKH